MPGKRRVITELVCADKFDDAHIKCLQGKCVKCGFKSLWMTVRQTLVYDNSGGKLRPDVSEVWLSNMIWDSIKTGGDGSNSEDDLRQQHEDTACSRVRCRGHGSHSCGPNLMVEGCTRTKQTFWTEEEFTVTASSGIRNRDVRVVEIVVRELEKTKPDKWGCVQTRELWSP
jgi:hypothetical protein